MLLNIGMVYYSETIGQKLKIMKTTKIIISTLALAAMATFTSCKKNYTCTCTTVVGTTSTTETHSIDNATPGEANSTCHNYQVQADNTLPGGTTCGL